LRLVKWVTTAASLLIVIGFCLYGSAGRDDAHITYWPAYTLAHVGEIINYNGNVVEQSSSLLQVVFISVLYTLSGNNIVTLGHFTSILFGVASLPLTYILASRFHSRAGPLATLITALCGSFVYWSFGGLETTLATFCVLWVLLVIDNILRTEFSPLQWGHACLAILALLAVRPEMPIVLACILLGTGVIVAWKDVPLSVKRRLGYLAILSTLATALLFTWRYLTFGYFFPLPVIAKSGFSVEQVHDGSHYLHNLARNPNVFRFGLTPIGIFGSMGTVALVLMMYRTFGGSRRAILSYLTASFSLAYISFIVLSGGDWMEAGRFIVPLVPVASAFISSEVYTHLKRRVKYISIIAVITVTVSTHVNILSYESTGIPILYRSKHIAKLKNSISNVEKFSWFEKYNKVNVRDMLAFRNLKSIVKKYDDTKTINVLGGRMGFMIFHLNKELPRRINIIDKRNLVTNTINECIKKDKFTRGKFGLGASIEEILKKRDELKHYCGIQNIDIIYRLRGLSLISKLENYGYKNVFVQKGYVMPKNMFSYGPNESTHQFIILREELYKSNGYVKNEVKNYLY